ncbi:MAG: hypothetical protein EOO62_11810, partial [Hymenobacter sp.]
MTSKQGILICGHGSRDKEGTAGFQELVAGLVPRYPDRIIDYGFLEFAHPIYAAAVERMYQQAAFLTGHGRVAGLGLLHHLAGQLQ